MMKKVVLLLSIVVFSLVANAAGQITTKKDLINRAKAIAAFHVIHNKGGEFKNGSDFKNAQNVDALEKMIKSDPDKKFEKICDEIEDYEVNEEDTSSLIKSFEVLLRKYKVGDKGALEQIKVPIKRSYRFFINEGTSNTETREAEDSEGDVDDNTGMVSPNSHHGIESLGTNNVPQEDKSNVSPDKRERTDGLSSLLPIVILSLALLGSLFFCFQLWLKNKKHEEELSKIHESFKKIAERAKNHKIANDPPVKFANSLKAVIDNIVKNESLNEKDRLEDEINNLKKRIKELEDSEKVAKKYSSDYKPNSTTDRGIGLDYVGSYEAKYEESHSPTVIWDNIQSENHETPIREQEAIVERVDSLKGKEMFLYLPNDNMFKDGSEEYRYGKTLYKMVYTSEETADFEFINKPETLAFAKQSRSRFLESACFIENDDAISFNTIQTLEKGKLSKVDEGWNIISKARIRLS